MEAIELQKLLDERVVIPDENILPEGVKLTVSLCVSWLYRQSSNDNQDAQLNKDFTDEELRNFRTTLAELLMTGIKMHHSATITILKNGEPCSILKAAVIFAIANPGRAIFHCFGQSGAYFYVTEDSYRIGSLPF